MRERAAVVITAVALDALFGEPEHLHPVPAMGAFLQRMKVLRSSSPSRDLLGGAAGLAAGVILTGGSALLLERSVRRISSRPGRIVVSAVALKPAFAIRQLLNTAESVAATLEMGDLRKARALLGTHLVSRDASALTEAEVAGAAIESVAENFTDSIAAPLLAYASAGLAAAYVYRFINTADAVLGYRTPELQYFGRPAARSDDVLNLVPARLAAALLVCAAACVRASAPDALRVALADHALTPSPNAGWTMSAMAGALGVRLTKRNTYVLNAAGREPNASDIRRACAVTTVACALAVIVSCATAARLEDA
jgi:adenosylcobinamide-phosphate synthase